MRSELLLAMRMFCCTLLAVNRSLLPSRIQKTNGRGLPETRQSILTLFEVFTFTTRCETRSLGGAEREERNRLIKFNTLGDEEVRKTRKLESGQSSKKMKCSVNLRIYILDSGKLDRNMIQDQLDGMIIGLQAEFIRLI